jgi:hypothetical protein
LAGTESSRQDKNYNKVRQDKLKKKTNHFSFKFISIIRIFELTFATIGICTINSYKYILQIHLNQFQHHKHRLCKLKLNKEFLKQKRN